MPHRLTLILVCAALVVLGLAATASAAPEPWGLMHLRAKLSIGFQVAGINLKRPVPDHA